jgi:hypothetical protein
MSQFEDLFIDPGHDDAERAAHELASAYGLRLNRGASGALYLGTPRLSASVGHVGGRIERNPYRMPDPVDPEDISIYDGLPIVWSLWADTGDATDREGEQRRRARVVFDSVEELIATYDRERGVREFPPGTPADGTGRHLWG